MNLSVNYHNGTDTISLKLSRTSGVVGIATTEGVINVEMSPQQWLEVIGEVRRKIAAVQLLNETEQPADLAAKIAEHGPAT